MNVWPKGTLFRGLRYLASNSSSHTHTCTHTFMHTHVQVNDKTEVGLTTTYNFQTSNVALGLAGKYTMEDGAQMKVRETRLGFHLAPYEVVTSITSHDINFYKLYQEVKQSSME